MTLRIMLLNMFELRRLGPKRRHVPIQLPHPPVQIRVPRPDIADIALEVLDVDGVEADDSRVQADVGLRDVGPVVVWPTVIRGVVGEMGFGVIERFEEGVDVFLVGFLGGGEAGFVHAVVDVVVGPIVGFVDFVLEGSGEEIDGFVLLGQQVVELGVHHADDFGGFVADDGFFLLVPEGGDSEAAAVVLVDLEVELAEVGVVWMEGVFGYVLAGDLLAFFDEAPAWGVLVLAVPSDLQVGLLTLFEHVPVHTGEADDVLQTFELPHDEGSVCYRMLALVCFVFGPCRPTPWTRIADIKVVAILLWWEL